MNAKRGWRWAVSKCQARSFRGVNKVLSHTGGNHCGGASKDLSAVRRNWDGQAGGCRLEMPFHDGSDAPDRGLLGYHSFPRLNFFPLSVVQRPHPLTRQILIATAGCRAYTLRIQRCAFDRLLQVLIGSQRQVRVRSDLRDLPHNQGGGLGWCFSYCALI